MITEELLKAYKDLMKVDREENIFSPPNSIETLELLERQFRVFRDPAAVLVTYLDNSKTPEKISEAFPDHEVKLYDSRDLENITKHFLENFNGNKENVLHVYKNCDYVIEYFMYCKDKIKEGKNPNHILDQSYYLSYLIDCINRNSDCVKELFNQQDSEKYSGLIILMTIEERRALNELNMFINNMQRSTQTEGHHRFILN